MKIIAFVGRSQTGKTTLIKKLVLELKNRGYKVGIIKNCHQDFSLSPEGKDTWQFMQAGAEGAAMRGPDRLAWLGKTWGTGSSLREIASSFFPHCDFVLVEGGHQEASIPKIVVLKKGISEDIHCSPDEVIAVVSDGKEFAGKPVFPPRDIAKIANFIEKGN